MSSLDHSVRGSERGRWNFEDSEEDEAHSDDNTYYAEHRGMDMQEMHAACYL